MTASALYEGFVVHKRVRPIAHALRYRVFTLLLDCDELPNLDRKLRLFSYNRFNVCSLYDADHGDGTPLPAYLRKIAAQSGVTTIDRFLMLCYPRMLGYGFNPVTVYFGVDHDGAFQLIIYEVNNTFGERQTYVVPVGDTVSGGTVPGATVSEGSANVSQSCEKTFYVSPFNSAEGRYRFNVTSLGDEFTLGIALHNAEGPVLKAYFRGARAPLTDKALFSALGRMGWLSVKVIVAIHIEAMKLWIKGLRLVKRPKRAGPAVSVMPISGEHGKP